jgi:hypothetical protein
MHRDLDIVVRDLLPEREMRITGVSTDQRSAALYYRIAPSLPERDPDSGEGAWLTWDWDGADDIGNSYDQWGGAYGPSDDGRSTLGELTLSPALALGARVLRVRLAPFRRDEGDLGTATVDIPLGARD